MAPTTRSGKVWPDESEDARSTHNKQFDDGSDTGRALVTWAEQNKLWLTYSEDRTTGRYTFGNSVTGALGEFLANKYTNAHPDGPPGSAFNVDAAESQVTASSA
jgi:hypothetical protein